MSDAVTVEVAGQQVRVSSPGRVVFSARGETKLDLVNYYLAVSDGVMRGAGSRPTVMKRYPKGADGDFFFQKRVPESRPEWLRTVTVAFPSGRTAEELCPADMAHVVWAVNLGCIDLNPWAVRRWDLEHPDELRIDLDPQPGNTFAEVRETALLVREELDAHGMIGFPKTSGSRGIHVNVRIGTRWGFDDVRKAAVALGRAVERRRPELVTTAWWKEERGRKVFVDYNQNARDRTVASAYSARANPLGMVSAPVTWEELPDIELEDFTIATVPARYAADPDIDAAIDDRSYSLEPLLELAARDEADGLGDAPWPPSFPKGENEPARVQPSRARPPQYED